MWWLNFRHPSSQRGRNGGLVIAIVQWYLRASTVVSYPTTTATTLGLLVEAGDLDSDLKLSLHIVNVC